MGEANKIDGVQNIKGFDYGILKINLSIEKRVRID